MHIYYWSDFKVELALKKQLKDSLFIICQSCVYFLFYLQNNDNIVGCFSALASKLSEQIRFDQQKLIRYVLLPVGYDV